MADVFISYKREERATAKALAEALTRQGYSVWWDVDLLSGDQFAKEIEAVLRKAKAAIVLWSEKSITSHWVLEEAELARQLGIVVPVLIEPVEPPFGFRNLNAHSLVGWLGEPDAPAVQSILAAIKKKAGPPAEPPRQTAAAVAEALDAFSVEAEYWRSISLATPQRPDEYEAYLARFGTGAQFADLARARIERLKAAGPGIFLGRGVKLAGGLLAAIAAIVTIGIGGSQLGFGPAAPVNSELGVADSTTFTLTSREIESEEIAVPSEPTYRPGETFRDPLSGGGRGPEMVVVPAGTFTMGSPDGETGRDSDEGPQRTVRIGYELAVGKYEVTWAEWEACMADGGCNGAADGNGWGLGNRPVINVKWSDAQVYVAWLSQKTGEDYRLLSEAEWEYVARAGTTSAYFWGADANAGCAYMNGPDATGERSYSRWTTVTCDDGYLFTAPVGSYRANAFGLYDMIGNVSEWVEDCYEDSYSVAPTDGSALAANDCRHRVVRGGDWFIPPQNLRSAHRAAPATWFSDNRIGFRVARTL